MLPNITATPSKSANFRASAGNPSASFEKASFPSSPALSPLPQHNGSPSSHRASPAISAIMKTPAVSANFAVYAAPERKQRIDVQAMLNEIHSRPSMAGMLGTGIVSALSAKTFADSQTSQPLEVRANLDRFIRSKLQVEACLRADTAMPTLSLRTFARSRTTSYSRSGKSCPL
jgi:hypothetical protein